MILYHGGSGEIVEIDLSKSIPNKDFGKGFYTTKIHEQAEIWARRKGRYNGTQGVVSSFEFNENAFIHPDYKTLRFPEYSEEWFNFVISNRDRNSQSPAHDYDIVEGPVADDDVYARIDAYLEGEISKETFLADLAQFPDSHQICFCTVKSLHMIKRTESKPFFYKIKKISMALVERLADDRKLTESDSEDLYFTSDTYAKLSDENSKFYEKPWEEIYEMLKKEKGM